MMTPEYKAEIEERFKRGESGEWVRDGHHVSGGVIRDFTLYVQGLRLDGQSNLDAITDLIAHAPADIKALLEWGEGLEKEIVRLKAKHEDL